jgi:hypothetical protein
MSWLPVSQGSSGPAPGWHTCARKGERRGWGIKGRPKSVFGRHTDCGPHTHALRQRVRTSLYSENAESGCAMALLIVAY